MHGPSRSFRLTFPADKSFESIQLALLAYIDYGKVGRPRKPPAKDVFELPSTLN